MVQKEVKKKTWVYGTIAVLSALILVSTIYTVSTPSMVNLTAVSPLKTFNSVDELKNYLTTNTQADQNYYFEGGAIDQEVFSARMGSTPFNAQPTAEPATMGQGSINSYSQGDAATPTYSTTNIQVAGVDEADSVKTDGSYLYVSSGNMVYIVNADPQDAKVLAKISLDNDSYVAGLFLGQNSSDLVVIGSQYSWFFAAPFPVSGTGDVAVYQNFVQNTKTFINVYDISDKTSPVLARNLTLSGSYFNSRLIGNYLYAVVSEQVYVDNNDVSLPIVYNQTATHTLEPKNIYYTDMVDTYFTYTTFLGVDISDNTQAPASKTILMGQTSNMYVSLNNMYVTFPSKDGLGTDIYRMGINGSELSFQAQGEVAGSVLNQYSMDEYNGNFRLATTITTGSWVNREQQNSIYVLNPDLTVVGKIENLGIGEKIYSARFTGDKCYLVTFKQVDPFFVVDLSNPTAPKVAGELKIPGYSSYLHPYDENHIIGIGKENSSVKLSLFDVTDMNNPTEIARFSVNTAYYSDSEALNDPKAFLFDLQKQLLVIPVSLYGYATLGGSVSPSNATSTIEPITSGNWQGVYVFNVNTTSGFTLEGTVTQLNSTATSYYYNSYNQWVNRALYIDNTLYTVSNSAVQLNNLDTLAFVAKVNLQ